MKNVKLISMATLLNDLARYGHCQCITNDLNDVRLISNVLTAFGILYVIDVKGDEVKVTLKEDLV